jgi:hypothetical protein
VNSIKGFNWTNLNLSVEVIFVQTDLILVIDEVFGQVRFRRSQFFEEAVAGQNEESEDVFATIHPLGSVLQLRHFMGRVTLELGITSIL